MEDDLNIFSIFSSLYLLVRLHSIYIPKISLIACLILEIAMKKTFEFFLSILLQVRLKASYMPKISFLGALEVAKQRLSVRNRLKNLQLSAKTMSGQDALLRYL